MSFVETALHGGVAAAYVVRQDVGLSSDYTINQENEVIPCMAQVFSYWRYDQR